MSQKLLSVAMLLFLSAAIASFVPAHGSTDKVANWDFDVYLDDKKVGKHLFEVSEAGGVKQVKSEASFRYKILFVSVYRYEHSAEERWTDNCLTEFDASTNANGKRIEVSGERSGAGFLVEDGQNLTQLPECVMTFAYWNPEFLDQPRLMNSQTGEYVDVQVERVGDEMLDVRGQPTPATRYKLKADKVDLTLWYSRDDEWLALESVATGGHIIRYELT